MLYQVGSLCYGSEESALSALAAQQSGAIIEQGGVGYVVNVTPDQGGLQYTGVRLDGDGPGFVNTVLITPQPCQLPGAEEGALYGGMILVIWAVAFGFRAVARLLWQSTGGGYDT